MAKTAKLDADIGSSHYYIERDFMTLLTPPLTVHQLLTARLFLITWLYLVLYSNLLSNDPKVDILINQWGIRTAYIVFSIKSCMDIEDIYM